MYLLLFSFIMSLISIITIQYLRLNKHKTNNIVIDTIGLISTILIMVDFWFFMISYLIFVFDFRCEEIIILDNNLNDELNLIEQNQQVDNFVYNRIIQTG